MNIIDACAKLREGKKIRRLNTDWLEAYDYAQLGLEDEYDPTSLCFFKNDKWIRSAELWIEDLEAVDWEIIESKELIKE